ncbi:MAG TPA: transposase [Gemmatimonadales bacterium]|nr:transposase [Gemmatimonadales bacterium]
MRTTKPSRHLAGSPTDVHLGTPHGVISPRVRAVGPEHFGIVAVDCAKARSKWMLTDFYGRVLIGPTSVEHRSDAFAQAIAQLRQARAAHDIRDLIVAVERTGRHHHLAREAFTAAGFDTRVVHPSISRHFRQASDFDNKTDDTDLKGITRAAVNGFALAEPASDPLFTALQLWVRHRRDLVEKSTTLRCQIREHLGACFPGYERCFDNVFQSNIALLLPSWYPTPQAIVAAGLPGLTERARRAGVRVHAATLTRILGWAQNAPSPDHDAELHQRLLQALGDDRTSKEKQVRSAESDIVGLLVQTPFVRLLALAGVNVVLAGEFAGEAGPMINYASGRVITGRAGLYPRRYQSDQVDHASGSLARRGNRRLRRPLLLTADTLIRCNDHFRVLAAKWSDQGKDPRDIRVRVAGRFARIAFQMVTGTVAFSHPACQGDAAVLAKLIEFHDKHNITLETTQTNLGRAAAALPAAERALERATLHFQWEQARGRRGRGPQQLCALLPAVLEKMVGGKATPLIKSKTSGETP